MIINEEFMNNKPIRVALAYILAWGESRSLSKQTLQLAIVSYSTPLAKWISNFVEVCLKLIYVKQISKSFC